MKPIDDMDMRLEWSATKQDLKVFVKNGGLLDVDILLYSSVTGFLSHLLEPRQAKWITEHYEKTRKKYVF